MSIPYIHLAQPNINPEVLDTIIEDVWDELSDETKECLVDTLKSNGVDFSL